MPVVGLYFTFYLRLITFFFLFLITSYFYEPDFLYACGIIILHNAFFTMALLVITSMVAIWKYRWMWSRSAVERLGLRKHVLLKTASGNGRTSERLQSSHDDTWHGIISFVGVLYFHHAVLETHLKQHRPEVRHIPPQFPLCALCICNMICVTVIPFIHPHLIDMQVY